MAEIKKYLDITALGTLVDQIKSEDAKGLQSAKDYADSLAKNYDASGSATSALTEAKAYTDALANGQVATNKADIAKLNGDVNTEGSVAKAVADAKALVDADVDAVESIANKNKEDIAAINNTENGILAQAKADATEKANAVQEAVDALAGKVGEVPADQTVMGIITNIQESAYDDTELRGLISGLETNKADKTQVATDIAAAVKVEEEARIAAVNGVQGNLDTLSQTHTTDKKALEDAIALKASQEDLNAVSDVANAAVKQSDYDTKVAALEAEDTRIVGLVEAEASTARAAEKANADAIKLISDDYLKAADKTELQGNIDVVSGKVTTLIGEDADKSVRTIANEELAKQLIAENAAESLDTLAEIAAWIQSHPEDASAMNKAIDDLEALVGTLPQGITATNVVDYIAEVKAAIQVEIDRLDAEKQDVITEVSAVSGNKTLSFTEDELYNSGIISTDVVAISDIISISASGEAEAFGDDGSWYESFDIGLEDFDVEGNSLVYRHPVTSVNAGSFWLDFTDSGINLGLDAAFPNSLTITYKSTVEGMVVKKEHLPSDVVYEADLNSAIDSLNTANTGLSAEIAKKADKTTVEGIDGRVGTVEDEMDVVEGKVSTLEGKVSTLEGSVATKVEQSVYDAKVEALEGVDSDLDERLALVEAQLGDGENSVSDLIVTAKQEAIDAAALDATTKANAAETNAKTYADGLNTAMDTRVAAVEAKAHEHSNKSELDLIVSGDKAKWDDAATKAHEHSNKTVLDGITSENVTTWNTVTSKASQTDLDNAVARIAVNEGAISTLNGTVADKAEQDDLDAAVARIAANEQAIAANTSAINSFTPITSDEVTALFA